MPDNNIHNISTATVPDGFPSGELHEYYAELRQAATLLPDTAAFYRRLSRIFTLIINQQTAVTQVLLSGAFAKTDYLLKNNHADHALSLDVNDTRIRLRHISELTEKDKQDFCRHDLRNLCRFVQLLTDTAIPDDLTTLFPTDNRPATARRIVTDCLRVVVDSIDDSFIYATTATPAGSDADSTTLRICYTEGNSTYKSDWTYLREMTSRGTQLNIIRPRMQDGVAYPELIIYEPDYLVNITSIARCFTNYAESALPHLLHKITPSANSEAIILGNFASQLLDEEIHGMADKSYTDSVLDFFRDNAIALLTADISPQFHNDARLQKKNIQSAMQQLAQDVSGFDINEVMVEPSFYSEMLGIQGRMDFLQLDYRVLLEQKSGKCGWPQRFPNVPVEKTEHRIQLLLYMLLLRYNYHEQYVKNNRELHACLMYSRYENSLLYSTFAPELTFRALKVRNEIAYSDLQCAYGKELHRLLELNADSVNENGDDSKLWERFQRLQMEQLLNPIAEASPLERAYYLRFLTFIANEHVLSKLGNKTKENSGFAAKWHDSLEEKLLAGNIYDRLTLVSPDADTEGRVESVVLAFKETADNDMSNFRIGDIVILYAYERNSEPDVRRTMVYRCSIEDITIENITLRLRAPQTDSRVFLREEGKLWAIEHDFMEASYNSLYEGIHSMLSAPKSRRDLLLLQREPRIDTSLTLRGDYGAFNEMALRVKQARDIFLIIGPPGTGKTSYGMLNTLQEELLEPEGSVLVMSFTNRAVDEICSKLVAEGIDFIRMGSTLSCAPEYREYLLGEQIDGCKNLQQLRDKIVQARVFVGTTTALNSHRGLLTLRRFSLAIVDEASQILEPHLAGLISAHNDGVPAIGRFVFIGDHKQLPAVVQQRQEVSRVDDALLNGILLTDCRLSLFERLLRRYGDAPAVTFMLTRQGRMHPLIADFPNIAFYDSRLRAVPLPHQERQLPDHIPALPSYPCDDNSPVSALPSHSCEGIINAIQQLLQTRRVVFIAADAPKATTSEKVNQTEADIIAATVVAVYRLKGSEFSVNETVGVIVPYRNQIATVRNTIDTYGIPELHNITIDTVERFQGSQRDYIIYGFTIQHRYQLSFLTDNVFVDEHGNTIDRKLNVAMTRAREHLIMVGNPQLLAVNALFKSLIDYTRAAGGYIDDLLHH